MSEEGRPSSEYNWWKIIWVLIVVVFAVMQWKHHISSVQHYDWLGFLDHDVVYQAERLMMNVQGDLFEPYHAMDVDYGVELTLLAWLVRPVAALTGHTLGLSAYQLIAGTHILAAAGCLGMMVVISRTLKWPPQLTTGTLVVLVSSPLFTTYAGLVKPDANVVLLGVLTSLWCVLKLRESGHGKWLWLAWGTAAFASAIKWWGVFMIPPLIYLQATYPPAWATLARTRIMVCIAGVMTVWVGWQSMFYLNQHFRKSGESPGGIPLRLMQFMDTWTAWILFALAVSGIMAALLYLQHRWAGKETKWSTQGSAAIETTTGLMACTLLLNLPFLLDVQFVNSFHWYTKFLIISPTVTSDVSIGQNAGHWLQDAFQSGLFSWVLAAMLCVMAWRLFRSSSGDLFPMRVMLLYLGSLFLFLFLLVTKKNHATQAMMFPLILLSLGQWLHTENWRHRWKLVMITVVALMQILIQNGLLKSQVNYPSVTQYYNSRSTLKLDIQSFHEQVAHLAKSGGTIYACDVWVPLTKLRERRLRIIDYKDADRLMKKTQPGDWLIFDLQEMHSMRKATQMEELVGWREMGRTEIPHHDRYGEASLKTMIFAQRINFKEEAN